MFGFLQFRDDGEEPLGFLRRQHGRRLIEDQKPGAEIKCLDDLDPLLFADRQFGDQPVRRKLEAEAAAEIKDLPARGAHIEREVPNPCRRRCSREP